MTQKEMEIIYRYLRKQRDIRYLTERKTGTEEVDSMLEQIYKEYLKLNRKYRNLLKEVEKEK